MLCEQSSKKWTDGQVRIDSVIILLQTMIHECTQNVLTFLFNDMYVHNEAYQLSEL